MKKISERALRLMFTRAVSVVYLLSSFTVWLKLRTIITDDTKKNWNGGDALLFITFGAIVAQELNYR